MHPSPSLSSIDFGFDRIGRQAAELLDKLMRGAKPPREPIICPPAELVLRESSDIYAVDDPIVAEAMRFIAEHVHEPIQVQDVAERVPASRRSLERRFRLHLDRSIADEITRLRLERAKRLLVETFEPLKSLARSCGFTGPKQMWKVFRRVEGISPGQYRRKHKKM
jgi:LacI family transcriptional regulator